jgi:hypothetical protein
MPEFNGYDFRDTFDDVAREIADEKRERAGDYTPGVRMPPRSVSSENEVLIAAGRGRKSGLRKPGRRRRVE